MAPNRGVKPQPSRSDLKPLLLIVEEAQRETDEKSVGCVGHGVQKNVVHRHNRGLNLSVN